MLYICVCVRYYTANGVRDTQKADGVHSRQGCNRTLSILLAYLLIWTNLLARGYISSCSFCLSPHVVIVLLAAAHAVQRATALPANN
jgi:hypothetical protein